MSTKTLGSTDDEDDDNDNQREAGREEHVVHVATRTGVSHERLAPYVKLEPAKHKEERTECARNIDRIGGRGASNLSKADQDADFHQETRSLRSLLHQPKRRVEPVRDVATPKEPKESDSKQRATKKCKVHEGVAGD
eukprot:scaffold191249_cov30-Tisochrysis_lutea.AAC.3